MTPKIGADHHKSNYLGVFLWLVVLTAGEVGVIYMPIPRLAIGILLVGFALSKAALVMLAGLPKPQPTMPARERCLADPLGKTRACSFPSPGPMPRPRRQT